MASFFNSFSFYSTFFQRFCILLGFFVLFLSYCGMFCRHFFENDAQANGPKSINQAWARRRYGDWQRRAERRSARQNEIGWRCYETKGIIAADDVARRKEEVQEAGKQQCKHYSQLAVKSEHLILQRKIKENSEKCQSARRGTGCHLLQLKGFAFHHTQSPFKCWQLVLTNFPRLMWWVCVCACVPWMKYWGIYCAYAASDEGTVSKWSLPRCHTATLPHCRTAGILIRTRHTHNVHRLVNPKLQLRWEQQEQSTH